MTTLHDEATRVREGEQLDPDRLRAYLEEHLDGAHGPIEVMQFPRGFSNLTYLLRTGEREMVLRRPPFGNVVKSAHDMGREFRVLSALHPVYPRAPKPLIYCEDESVLGAPFYIMDRRRGVILRGPRPEGIDLNRDTMRRLCESFVDGLVELHALDYAAAGLGDLGRPEGYIERQVKGWARRYDQAKIEVVPAMDHLAEWLTQHMPPEGRASLIHNDYKFDNLVLDSCDLSRIVGVLDWEMCTLGDPMMDLGSTLAYWVDAEDSPARKAFIAGPTELPGCMTRTELAERYASATGHSLDQLLFYYIYGVFKLAVIIQQIYARYVRGHTRDARFASLGDVMKNLAGAATEAVGSGRV